MRTERCASLRTFMNWKEGTSKRVLTVRGCPQGSPRYFRDWRRSRWRRGEKNEWNPLEGRFCASDLCRSALTFTTLHIHTRACHTNPPSVFEVEIPRYRGVPVAVSRASLMHFSTYARCWRATCALISEMFVYRNVTRIIGIIM